jgi:hypothetical protein
MVGVTESDIRYYRHGIVQTVAKSLQYLRKSRHTLLLKLHHMPCLSTSILTSISHPPPNPILLLQYLDNNPPLSIPLPYTTLRHLNPNTHLVTVSPLDHRILNPRNRHSQRNTTR